MQHVKIKVLFLAIGCIAATALAFYGSGGLDPAQLLSWLRSTGFWAPLFYILLYTIATVLIMPSTPLNLLGGALFGPWLGTLWTSAGAVLAAIVTFAFTRTLGRKAVARKLSGRWQALDAEVRRGGLLYMIAIRLVPFMPYGLLNFAAGLTSVSYRDYLLGTLLGTTPGLFPYVLLGSSGLRAIRTGDVLPFIGALTLTGLFIGGTTWYRHQRSRRPKASPPTPPSECIDPQDK
ncbi:MAG: TVP38/TMEM64 family protein [Leptolyngbya sp. BL-A-14]